MPWSAVARLSTALLVLAFAYGRAAFADGSTAATNTDAYAREQKKEYEELDRDPTPRNVARQLEILDGLRHAPCGTAQRFLLKLFGSRRTPGDPRLHAMQALLWMADAKALDDILKTLVRSKDPTLWQGFGEALAEGRSKDVRAWLPKAGLDSHRSEIVGACLDALARRPDAAVLPRVKELFRTEAADGGDGDVAARALRALVRGGDPEARATLVEAARHRDVRLRLVTAGVLPGLQPFDVEAESATRALLQDDEPAVRQTAARAVGLAKRSALRDALIVLLTDPRLLTRHVAAKALERISGRQLGHDPRAWAAWREKREPGAVEDLTFPTYHGVSVHTDAVVFLVDASSSMTWPWEKETHRIDVARTELAAVLRELPPETRFNVIVYSEKQRAWRKQEAEASPGNVESAVKWASKAMEKPQGDTCLFEALQAAFEADPEFDTVFLLTDGNPTAGRYWTSEGLLASVRAWTRYRPTPIHTIGLSLADEDRGRPNLSEDLGLMEKVLEAIAAQTDGEFRSVLRVPPAR